MGSVLDVVLVVEVEVVGTVLEMELVVEVELEVVVVVGDACAAAGGTKWSRGEVASRAQIGAWREHGTGVERRRRAAEWLATQSFSPSEREDVLRARHSGYRGSTP